MSEMAQARTRLLRAAVTQGHVWGPISQNAGGFTSTCKRCSRGWVSGPTEHESELTPCTGLRSTAAAGLACVVPGCRRQATHSVSWNHRPTGRAEIVHACEPCGRKLLYGARRSKNFRTPSMTSISPQRQKAGMVKQARECAACDGTGEFDGITCGACEGSGERPDTEVDSDEGIHHFTHDQPAEHIMWNAIAAYDHLKNAHGLSDAEIDRRYKTKKPGSTYWQGNRGAHDDVHAEGVPQAIPHQHGTATSPDSMRSQGQKVAGTRCTDCGGFEQYPGEHQDLPVLHGTTRVHDENAEGGYAYMNQGGMNQGLEPLITPDDIHPGYGHVDTQRLRFDQSGGGHHSDADLDHLLDNFTPLKHSLNKMAGFDKFQQAADSLMDRAHAHGHHVGIAWGRTLVDNMGSTERHTLRCKNCGARDQITKQSDGTWQTSNGSLTNAACTKERVMAVTKVAHDSGDGETIYHCPFCGSGQVIARSDRTIECEFCHTAFTVQVQPQLSAFPQTINGAPVQVPGMPGEIGSDAPDQPDDMSAEPMSPDDLADDGSDSDNPFASDDDQQDGDEPMAPDDLSDDEDDEDQPQQGGGGFSGKPSGQNQPPWLKNNPTKRSSLHTLSGATVAEDDMVRRLALRHADNREQALEAVRGSR